MLLNHTLQSVSLLKMKTLIFALFVLSLHNTVYYSIYFSTQIRMMYSKGAGRF